MARRKTMAPRHSTLVVGLLATFFGCGSDEAPIENTPGATLASSPSSLATTDAQPTTSLFLTTTPSGGRLQWQTSAKPSWVTLQPDQGVVQGITEVKVTTDAPATADPGTLVGRIDLVSSGGAVSVPITLTIAANPKLNVSASTLTIAATSDTGQVSISNPGRGTLSWTISGQPTWLTVLPTSGFIATGQSATVKFVPDRQPLPAGPNAASLTVRGENTGTTASLGVTVDVPAAPRASIGVSRLVFSQGTTSRAIYLVNSGKGPLVWQATNQDAWLTLVPSSGTLAAGDSVRVVVSASGLAGSNGGFTITSNAVDAPSIRVAAVVQLAAPALGVRLLDHNVIDAEFNLASGLIVTVSADPSRLNVLDMETGATWSVGLPKPPCCVAVRGDGRFAAVAHDASVSYVDLTTRQLMRTYSTTSDAIDVLLPPNGYVYVFPRTDQWQPIHAVNLTSGLEELGVSSIFAGTRAKLHPSGQVAYGIWYLSPADLEKYDVTTGKARTLRDSPYHGDFPMGYHLWIATAGDRIFTEAGTVFRSSSAASEDMRYSGRLADMCGARMISDSPPRNRIYAFVVPTVGLCGIEPQHRTLDLHVYESTTLNALGRLPLPLVSSGGKQVIMDGHYVFPSFDGQRVYVLMKAGLGSGVTQEWALYIVDAASLP